MAFRDFSFPEVLKALGLTLAEADLFGGVPAIDFPTEVWVLNARSVACDGAKPERPC